MLLPGQLEDPATVRIKRPSGGTARGEPVTGGRVIRLATAAVVSYSRIYGLAGHTGRTA